MPNLPNEITHSDRARTLIDNNNEARTLHISKRGNLGVRQHFITTRPFNFPMHQVLVISPTIVLVSTPLINTYTIELNSGHSLIVGTNIAIVMQLDNYQQYILATIMAVDGNILTLDVPISYPFDPAKTAIYSYTDSLKVDGSVTPQIFRLYNPFTEIAHITSFSISISDVQAMDGGTFGGLPKLARGVVLRKKYVDGTSDVYFNFKTNSDISYYASRHSYDTNGWGGVYNFTATFLFAEQGFTIEGGKGVSMELIVQDDLTELSSFEAGLSGHFDNADDTDSD